MMAERPLPAGWSSDPGWWTERIERLRRQHQTAPGAPPADDDVRADLALAMERIGHKVTGRYRQQLGQAALEDLVLDAIWGTSGRKGLLARLAAGEPGDKPLVAWLSTSFKNRCIDALRHQTTAQQTRDDTGPSLAPGSVDPAPSPTALPSHVARALGEASAWAAVLLALLPQLPADHRLRSVAGDDVQAFRRDAGKWERLSGFLASDVARGTARPPWTHGGDVAAQDNWSRAWQAVYYDQEGTPDFAKPGEIPASKTSAPGNAFDQHLSRFRNAYALATAAGTTIVERADPDARREAERARLQPLPLLWDAPIHPSLAARETGARPR